ncbi:hypothetical protein BZA05DRAFT_392030 [Tricharina praecox]|uniref:uncharacterized protein n=1 Tax=Tricharina praecox TaxID=43433 RepID=UPI0022206F97|nr:uncharacterized protein BZA05DRAFT_392030 [Tricharina praecox]KAI5854602.1 hypothetical protein BZA05DRAFT_392030 [Tricharina praecox]
MEPATFKIDEMVPLVDLNEPAGATVAAMVTSSTISADEVALYDRQIRLWGMEAQERMRNANVLIITMRALANEVAKNLVLAGIGSLTVLDSEDVVEDDLGAQFFVSEEHVGINRAIAAVPTIQKLNPRVRVYADAGKLHDKPTEYFNDFDIVIATELGFNDMHLINEATRKWGIRFYAAATYGLYGFVFADLIRHQFVLKRVKANKLTQCGKETRTRSVVSTTETKEGATDYEFVTKEEIYCTLSEAVASRLEKSWRPKKRHQVGSVLPGILGLWKFQQEFGRLPESTKEDYKQFTKLMIETGQALEMPQELVRADFIRQFVGNVSAELSPVAAVLGGILAQDAINVLGKMEQPIQNLLLFDGDTSEAPIIVLAPQED